MSLRIKLLSIVISSVVFAVLFVSGVLMFDLKDFSAKMQADTEMILMDNVKENLRSVVDMAAGVSKDLFASKVNPKKITKSKIKKLFNNYLIPYWDKYHNPELIKDLIASFRYKIIADDKKNSGYFFAIDMNGVMISHPKKSLVGKNLINLKDKKGFKFIKKMIEVVKAQKKGYINYYWENPRTGKIELKTAYVRLFEPLNIIVGTGAYNDDIIYNTKAKIIKELSSMRYGKNKNGYLFAYTWDDKGNYYFAFHGVKHHLNGKKTISINLI